MPIINLPRLLLGWLSLAILAGAVWLLWDWSQGEWLRQADGDLVHIRPVDWRLWLGGALLAWSFLGRFIVLMLMPGKPDEPKAVRAAGEMLPAGDDGARVRVDRYGAGARTVVLTHGWGLNATVWGKTIAALQDRFSLVAWDLPGLGRSERLKGEYTLDRFAQALGAVVESCEDRVVLVGHSIGGMTTETFWRACPAALRRRVAGMVLVNTTHHNPLDTMLGAPLWMAIQKPLLEPISRLTPLVSPLVWLSNWQAYLSGSAQLATRLTAFGRYASRGEVDFAARLTCKGSPAVQAHGNLAMMRWSADEILADIDVPVLILAGGKDIITLPRASQTMAGRIPGARLVEIEGVGHMGFLERAEDYNREIADFAEAAFLAAERPADDRAEPARPFDDTVSLH